VRPSPGEVALWEAIGAWAKAPEVSDGRMNAVVAVSRALAVLRAEALAEPTSCPQRGHVAPTPDPAFVLDEPEHKHVRVGAFEYCFRRRVGVGWQAEGGVAVATGHVLTDASYRESARVARAAMSEAVTGAKPAPAFVRCPSCEQLFAEAPAGVAPHEWTCAPRHRVVSGDRVQTTYDEGGALATVAVVP
jgi:hypothetical protein